MQIKIAFYGSEAASGGSAGGGGRTRGTCRRRERVSLVVPTGPQCHRHDSAAGRAEPLAGLPSRMRSSACLWTPPLPSAPSPATRTQVTGTRLPTATWTWSAPATFPGGPYLEKRSTCTEQSRRPPAAPPPSSQVSRGGRGGGAAGDAVPTAGACRLQCRRPCTSSPRSFARASCPTWESASNIRHRHRTLSRRKSARTLRRAGMGLLHRSLHLALLAKVLLLCGIELCTWTRATSRALHPASAAPSAGRLLSCPPSYWDS